MHRSRKPEISEVYANWARCRIPAQSRIFFGGFTRCFQIAVELNVVPCVGRFVKVKVPRRLGLIRRVRQMVRSNNLAVD